MASRRGRRRQPLFYNEETGGGPVPGVHATTHASGGSDPLDLALIAGVIDLGSQVTSTLPLANAGLGADFSAIKQCSLIRGDNGGAALTELDHPADGGTYVLRAMGADLASSTLTWVSWDAPSHALGGAEHTGELPIADLGDEVPQGILCVDNTGIQWHAYSGGTTGDFLVLTGGGAEDTWAAHTLVAGDIPDLSATYAAASHNHAASDITSGLLALARGGTGADFSAVKQCSLIRGDNGGAALTELDHPADGGTYVLRATGADVASSLLTWVAWEAPSHTLGGASHTGELPVADLGDEVPGGILCVDNTGIQWHVYAGGSAGDFLMLTGGGAEDTWAARTLEAGDIPDLSATYAAASHEHAGADITSGLVALDYGGTGVDLSAVKQCSLIRGDNGGAALTELDHPADGGTYFLRAAGADVASSTLTWVTVSASIGGTVSSPYVPYASAADTLDDSELNRTSATNMRYEGTSFYFVPEVGGFNTRMYGYQAQPELGMYRADGSEGSETGVTNGMGLGEWYGYGYDGAAYTQGAAIKFIANSTWDNSPASHSAYMLFYTRLTSGALTARWVIEAGGGLRPYIDETYSLGTPSYRVNTTYTKYLNVESTSMLADATMSGTLSVTTIAPTTELVVTDQARFDSVIQIGNVRADGRAGIMRVGNNATSGYAILADAADTYVNAPTSVNIRTNNTARVRITSAGATFYQTLGVTGRATFTSYIAANAGIDRGGITTSLVRYSGGSSTILGANMVLYGEAHATDPWDILFRANSTTKLQYDHSDGRWEFKVPALFDEVVVSGQSYPSEVYQAGTTTSVTIDWDNCNVQQVNMSGNCTINIDSSSNMKEGAAYTLIVHGHTTSSYTLTIAGTDYWEGTSYSAGPAHGSDKMSVFQFQKVRNRADDGDLVYAITSLDQVTALA